MNDLEELELDPEHHPIHASDTAAGPEESPGRPLYWIIPLILVGAAILIYFLWLRDKPGPVDPSPVEAAIAAPRPEEEAAEPEDSEPEIVLPPLDESDAAIRELVSRLSAHPRLAALLIPDSLVRRFVAAVDNVAEGVSPRNHLRKSLPAAGFEVSETSGGARVAAESFERWDGFADVFHSLDAAGSARLVEALAPLFAESYRDLGYPDADFTATLKTAIRQLLRTPAPTGTESLEREVITWSYTDPKLEALSPAQKDLFRTGPRNVPLIQAKLLEIGRALGMPEAELTGR